MTEKQKQYIINNVDATMCMEDMPLTEQNKKDIRNILDGKTTTDEIRRKIIERYKK